MKIASIDYGLNVGLAIAEFYSEDGLLERLHLGTHYIGDEEVAKLVLAENCELVIMEEPPYSNLGGSANSFYKILGILKKNGYSVLDSDRIVEKSIMRYLPGTWKPLVQAAKPDLSPWDPKTIHEKDAMGIMWYALRTVLKTEIKYA